MQHVSIPPGIIIWDSCKSKNCTNRTNNICTYLKDIECKEDGQLTVGDFVVDPGLLQINVKNVKLIKI
jgi:hypothetical protein